MATITVPVNPPLMHPSPPSPRRKNGRRNIGDSNMKLPSKSDCANIVRYSSDSTRLNKPRSKKLSNGGFET
jgi:hypothetical protein